MVLTKVTKESGIPLIGHLAFGIVVRGSSNLIQVRPTTICNLNCPFCSTDGGPHSATHINHYIVDPSYLLEGIREILALKESVHVNIDSVGEPTTYPYLTEFIAGLGEMEGISMVSMQTNGTLLTKEKISELEEAGLKRINLSIHAMSEEMAKMLAGAQNYDINQIKRIARAINDSGIELLIAPVYLPGVNEKEIEEIIKFAKELNCKIAIQKYEEYKYSRKMKQARKQNFYKFYAQLKKWGKEFRIRLVYNAESLEVRRARAVKCEIKEGERANVRVVAEGWMRNQKIAAYKNRCITISNCHASVNDRVNVKITGVRNNICLAEMPESPFQSQKNL